ncbi:MAG: Y-family DNA polymerase [Bacteroidota bacterium]
MKVYALVDCNQFYVSCERVFDADARGKPVVVLSNNDGCVIARSPEAKALNIEMGVPYFKAREEMDRHGVRVFSSNYTLYGDLSERVMNTLEHFSPAVEVYSIDEAFAEIGHVPTEELWTYGQQIRNTVYQWTGIPVKVGIATSRTLAKIAADQVKKLPNSQGVVSLVEHPQLDEILDQTPVGKVWGIGRGFAETLRDVGFHTAKELRDAPEGWVRKTLKVIGQRVAHELRGEDRVEIGHDPEDSRMVMFTRSFGEGVTRLSELEEAVTFYTTRAAHKLREQKQVAGALHVSVKTNKFRTQDQQYRNSMTLTLPGHTDHTPELIHYALAALRKVYQEGIRYKKAGITLYELAPKSSAQRGLFQSDTPAKTDKLMQVMDQLTAQHGKGTLKYAKEGTEYSWQMKAEMRSPRYTTQWSELLTVNA